jgi:hypothetical protein
LKEKADKEKFSTTFKVQLGSFIKDRSTRKAIKEKLESKRLHKEAFLEVTKYWQQVDRHRRGGEVEGPF